MRPGIVATIRVNPKDCMAVVDVMEAVGITTEGMSFPAMISLTLSSLLQTARDNNQIPTRDGFEYNEIMAPYQRQKRNKRKLEITDTLHKLGSSVNVPKLSKPPRGAFQVEPGTGERLPSVTSAAAERGPFELPVEDAVTADVLRARRRLTELLQKKDLADEGKLTWQSDDEREFQEMYKLVYPEG